MMVEGSLVNDSGWTGDWEGLVEAASDRTEWRKTTKKQEQKIISDWKSRRTLRARGGGEQIKTIQVKG